MPVSEVHHVAVTVADLERSARFYEVALGYTRTLRSDVSGPGIETSLGLPSGTTGRVQYLQGPSRIGQLELIEWNGEARRTPGAGHLELGTFLLSFEVPRDELGDVYARVEENGGVCVAPIAEVVLENYGPISAFAARDPDGNLLEFVSLPTRAQILAHRAGEDEAGSDSAAAAPA